MLQQRTWSLGVLILAAACGEGGDGAPQGAQGTPTTTETGGGGAAVVAQGAGGSAVASGGAPTANGGSVASSGGAPLASGGSAASRGGAPLASGGSAASSGGAPLASGGSAASRGGAPLASGGSAANSGGAPLASGGSDTNSGGAPMASGGARPMPDPNDNVTNPEPDEVIGFGAKTTGGKGGKEVTVTSAAELKAAAESAEPMIITVQGKIVHNVSGGGDDARIFVKSNKTIQGADASASVDANFNAVSVDNVIFRNLTVSNEEGKGTGDGIEFTKGSTNIWINHVTFAQNKDGALDFKVGSDNITVSWCKFAYTSATHNHNFANLVGHSDGTPGDRGKLRVTMHHNWYAQNVIERMPRVRYGQVHVFNNYYSSERTHYVIGVGVESQILLEASYFENQGDQTWYNWYSPNKCPGKCADGRIQWTEDNVFDNTTVSTWAPNSDVFDPPYKYEHVKQSAVNAKASVMAKAGVH